MTDSNFCGLLPRTKVKVDKDGGFVMPLEFRQSLGLKTGDEIIMSWKGGELCIKKVVRHKPKTRSLSRR